MKNRSLFNTLAKYLEHKNALVITGMRQVGKTTLMKQLFEAVTQPKLWFDFENPLDTMMFESEDYKSIWQNLQKAAGVRDKKIFVFIDEIQMYPAITRIMKYLIDHYGVKFIVTGSSAFYLKNLFPESMSGRKFLYTLSPLSFREYLFFHDRISEKEMIQRDLKNALLPRAMYEIKKYESDYADYLEFGGFPEVVTTEDIETKRLVLKNIFASFFEKEILMLSDYKDIRELRDVILLLVPRAGNILDITRLASELKITRLKLYGYIEFLQGVFFIRLISKFTANIDRSVAGGKKIYFSDSGLLNVIGKVSEGQLFENTLANQLSEYGELTFYNKQSRAEIDFILNKEIAFEAKRTPTQRDLKKLERLSSSLGLKEHYLISPKYSTVERTIYPMFL